VINGTKSSQRLIIWGASQGRVLGPVMPNIFMNHMEGGLECILGKFTDNRNLEKWLLDQTVLLSFRGSSTV